MLQLMNLVALKDVYIVNSMVKHLRLKELV